MMRIQATSAATQKRAASAWRGASHDAHVSFEAPTSENTVEVMFDVIKRSSQAVHHCRINHTPERLDGEVAPRTSATS
jgi:hypothetical protein